MREAYVASEGMKDEGGVASEGTSSATSIATAGADEHHISYVWPGHHHICTYTICMVHVSGLGTITYKWPGHRHYCPCPA